MNEIIIIVSFLIGATLIFQLSLALGAPLGEAALGGRWPGKFSTGLRIIALIQALILIMIELIILVRAAIILPTYLSLSEFLIWFIVGFFVIGSIMNMLTQNYIERNIWAPINIILLTATTLIALS